MAWKLVTTLLDGTPVGEVTNAHSRTVHLAFNGRLKTCGIQIRLEHPLADHLLSGQALVKAYDAGTLRFIGALETGEETSNGGIALSFSDPFAVLQDRLIGKSAAGYTDATALAPKDKSTLVADILTAVNTDAYTGIELGDVADCGATGYATYTPYKPASDAVTEIVNNLDGPDIEIIPQEPATVTGGVRVATLDVKPAVGQARPNAVFEYAVNARNVSSYRRAVTGRVANRIYGLPPTGDPVSSSDGPSIGTYGLREQVIAIDLPQALLQTLVDENVRIRKTPRQIISFAPSRDDPAYPGRVPHFGEDFFLGDLVTFRAVEPITGSVRVDAALRVYAIDWTISDEGDAIPTFTLTQD